MAASRSQAEELIAAGQVLVAGSVAERAARLVSSAEPVELAGPPPRFVSRGGEKLQAALERFGVVVEGRRAVDAGASTGGFTDCLLQSGAAHVVAIDVGRGQLHERLRRDPRVTSMERTNVRTAGVAAAPFDVVVADLSFISLRLVATQLAGWAVEGGDVIVLVKPQFEAGRREASRGRGVIRDPSVWRTALEGVVSAFTAAGATMMGVMVSPLRGADGNVEFLAHFRAGASPIGAAAGAIGAAVAQAVEGD